MHVTLHMCVQDWFTTTSTLFIFLVRSCQKNAIQQHSQLQQCKHEPSKESVYDEVEFTENQVVVSRNPAYAVITRCLLAMIFTTIKLQKIFFICLHMLYHLKKMP